MLPSWANSCNGAKSAEAVIASFIGTETAFLSPSCIAFSLRSFSSYISHSKTTLTWNRQIKILTLSIFFWEISKGKSHFESEMSLVKYLFYKQCFFYEWTSDQLNISSTFFSSKLDSHSPMFWLEKNLILSNGLIREEPNPLQYFDYRRIYFWWKKCRRNVQLIGGSFGKEIPTIYKIIRDFNTPLKRGFKRVFIFYEAL